MRRMSVSVLMLMVLISLSWGQAAPEFGQIWHESEQNPTSIEYRVPGSWSGGSYSFATWGHVLWDGDQYRLYVSRKGPSPENTLSIGLFFSPHLDSAWVPHESNPIFEPDSGSWDSSHVATPMVIKDGDIYKMWYAGWSGVVGWSFGYAESSDGITWTRETTPILSDDESSNWDYYWALAPYVVKEDENTYTMYYAGQSNSNSEWKIGCAHSLDGISWSREAENPVLGIEGTRSTEWVHIPRVKKIDGKYIMWFAGATDGASTAQIGTAVSSDGTHWRKDDLYYPSQAQGPSGSWADVGVYPLEVFEDGGAYKLYYAGIDQSWEYFGYGYSTYHPTIVPAGDVSGNWTKSSSPYRVQGEITIPDGETLTIEAGTTIEFLTHDKFRVDGRLLATGTEEEQIRFMVDDTLGFSNDAGSDGVWGGIRYEQTAESNDSSLISYCEIAYAKTFSGSSGMGTGGGGVYIDHFNKLTIEHSRIHSCKAIGNSTNAYGWGAGITVTNYSSPTIRFNTIEHNIARHLFRDHYGSGAGIMIYSFSDPDVIGNRIRYNRCTDASAGIGVWENSSPMIINNLIHGNVAKSYNPSATDGAGGGVGVGWGARPVLINNTITQNSANWTGGGLYSNEGSAIVINTIIADNEDMNAEDLLGNEVGCANMSENSLLFRNSVVLNGRDNIYWWQDALGHTDFAECLFIDPQLTVNYVLNTSRSQCFGAGTPSCEIDGVSYNAPSVDIDGNTRPDPTMSNPDIGAFESHLSAHRVTSHWNWWSTDANPVFSPGVAESYDDVSVYGQDVLIFEGLYHMWYTGDNGVRKWICHATSSDGVNWDRDPDNPVLVSDPAGWQDEYLDIPRVVLVGDVLHMWFRSNARAGHATSADGTDWTFTEGPVLEGSSGIWDSDFVVMSDVIYMDSLFHGWYTGSRAGVTRVGYATSPNGIEWTKDVENNPVFEPSESGWDSEELYASSVVFNGEYYYMWYMAHDNSSGNMIGRATSINGTNWIRTTATDPAIGPGVAGAWNASGSYLPSVLLDHGMYEMWYNGWSNVTSMDQIGYASMEPTHVEAHFIELPQSFMLNQNYPNPFNPMTHIRYSIPENGDVSLVIYDLLGREIVELLNGYRSVGNYETTWYGFDQNGNQVSTGVYFARLEAGRQSDVIKMLYLK